MFYIQFSLQRTTQSQQHFVIEKKYSKVYQVLNMTTTNVINLYSLNYAKQLITRIHIFFINNCLNNAVNFHLIYIYHIRTCQLLT